MSAVYLITVGSALIGAIAGGQGIIQRMVPNKEHEKEDVVYQIFDDEQSKGGFRLILVNQEKGSTKAIRVHKVAGSNEYYELKCGDAIGNKAKSDLSLRYDLMRVDFPSDYPTEKDYFTLILMKQTFGIWVIIDELRIYRDRLDQYDGKTLVIYWADDHSYFKDEKNLIKPFEL